LKIPSPWPTCAKPKLSSFHQDWHLFVLFPFLSIIIYFPHFPECKVCNSFWLILSCSYRQSLYLYHRHCLSPTNAPPCLILDNTRDQSDYELATIISFTLPIVG
jgi:hypothetical protein